MKLVFRYLKPHTLTLMISVVFLFVQAVCELGLPNLMSDMVNTGIQAGGVEEGAPEAISAEGMAMLRLFADERGAAAIEQGYALADSAAIAERYPAAPGREVYRLGAEAGADVDDAYTRSVYALTLALQGMGGEAGAGAEPAGAEASEAGAGAHQAGTIADVRMEELYAMLPMLSEAKAAGAFDDAIAAAAGDISLAGAQVGVTFTRLFYGELGADLDRMQRDYIYIVGLKMIGVALLSVVAAIVVGWCAAKVGTQAAQKLRRDVFEKVSQFSNAEYDRFSTASLITRTTNDIQQIQMLILMGVRMICYAPIMGIGGIILAVDSSASMSWVIAVAVLSIIGLVLVVFALALPKFKALQKLIDKLNLVSRENLSGMMVIRAFGNEGHEEHRFEKANGDLRRTNRFIQRTMAFMFPMMMLIMNLVTLLVIWVGARAIASSELQIGNMMAFMQYAMMIIMSFLMLSMVFIMVPRAIASSARVREVLDTELTINEPAAPMPMPEGPATIQFRSVGFRYQEAEEDVLHDISFTARPGETTAFIGTTGAGKSTVVNLMPRFYDVTGGQILYNGVDIRELPLTALRERIGYVPQKGVLFSGDIAGNVRYGRESASEDEIREALEVAQAKSFVESFEQGMASPISQGGKNVSGGQRQRLSIARALLRRAPVYIFDDSFSALDLKTDAALRKALKTYTKDATVLLVAQRVSTIMNAEQIIVLDKGVIVGKGTHRELLETCPAYRDIAESQLSKEELA